MAAACLLVVVALGGPATAIGQQSGDAPYGADKQEAKKLEKLKRSFLRALRKELIREGLSKKGATCVVNELGRRMTDRDIRRLAKGKRVKGLPKRARKSTRVCLNRMGRAILA
jgi:hypothetical protein